ncbi:hypothetical protein Bca4012_026124 [Brassica carinata]
MEKEALFDMKAEKEKIQANLLLEEKLATVKVPDIDWDKIGELYVFVFQMTLFTMETTMKQVIPIFNGESYGFWKIQMITILKIRKLWDVIENGVTFVSSS